VSGWATVIGPSGIARPGPFEGEARGGSVRLTGRARRAPAAQQPQPPTAAFTDTGTQLSPSPRQSHLCSRPRLTRLLSTTLRLRPNSNLLSPLGSAVRRRPPVSPVLGISCTSVARTVLGHLYPVSLPSSPGSLPNPNPLRCSSVHGSRPSSVVSGALTAQG
jgi:hypothetical protein